LEDDTVGLISPAYVVFKPKPNSIIPQLLLKFLKSTEGLRQIKLHARGTVRQALRFEDLCKIELSIPDYDSQLELFKRIEETEIETSVLINEFSHQLSLVKQLRQSFLREAMQGKLVPQDPNDEPASVLLEKIKAEKEQLIKEKKIKKEKPLPPISEDEIPFEIPENWVWCRLGEIVLNFQNGISSRGENDGEKITVIRLADITLNKVDFSDLREIKLTKKTYERYLLDESDILITRVNGSLELVGNFNFVGNINIKITACDHFIRMQLSKNICSFFIFLLGRMPHIRKSIEENFKTTSGQKTVNQGHINNLIIALPPLHEQEQIVAKLEELMAFCDGLEQSIKESQGYNEMLLQQVLREVLEPK
jgi:type I restriction enzyme S subunit